MRLSEGMPLKTSDNSQARNSNINRAHVYENRIIWTYPDLHCSGHLLRYHLPQKHFLPEKFYLKYFRLLLPDLRVVELISENYLIHIALVLGIVQKVFSEKASAIARMRQKCVRNASKWVFFYWEKRNVQNASEIRQNCVKYASKMRGTPLGGNTFWTIPNYPPGTPVLVELFFITVTRFEVFRINWVIPREKRHININFLLWLTSRWPWDKRLVVPGVNRAKKFYVFASKHRKYKLFPLVNRRVVPGLSRLSKSLCVQSLCAFFLP